MRPPDPDPDDANTGPARRVCFDLFGARDTPESPVVLSVPHAGRDYPLELRAMLRAPLAALVALEDRHMDTLALAARARETLIVQRRPRAWIDLNRAESERDPQLDDGAPRHGAESRSAKVRGGLGLVPRRTAIAGDLWRRRMGADEVERRIVEDHRPYHVTLGEILSVVRRRFGTAVLLDLHSMPSLPGRDGAQVVIGDRFGRASASRFVARIEGEIEASGLRRALNIPYAGGHILDRHAAPARGIHAIQLELDRTLYLDAHGDAAGPGCAATVALIRRIVASLADEALVAPATLAAE